ncbi:hypothetical protein E24_00237 [Faustovirus]|nr:hypothetical protein PRJ_Fausto_00222 [Faustovirus]AMN83165.1 hypothetical protein E24_00237 [Faustovirus]AMN84145.1 hypothetical protein D5a_00235 [Faustovirus]AMN85134.1 hypothetical protein E23_00236 [Faustovirus]QBR99130.1 hypothetical protein [Faustovirus mariensis]
MPASNPNNNNNHNERIERVYKGGVHVETRRWVNNVLVEIIIERAPITNWTVCYYDHGVRVNEKKYENQKLVSETKYYHD